MKVQLQRQINGYFSPDSQHDEDQLKSVHTGDVVTADIKKSRNPQFHRKGFAMLKEIFDNQDSFTDFDQFRTWLQIAAGIVDTIIGPDGKTYYKVKSLAWDKMDEIQFDKTYQAFITAAFNQGHEWVADRYA